MKKPHRLFFVSFTFLLLFNAACKKKDPYVDILGAQLAKVKAVAPADNFVTSDNAITFSWEKREGATSYLLQIASPDFGNILNIIHSIEQTETQYTVEAITTGTYQWRVRAYQGAVISDYSNARKIEIQ